ncbi:MAG: glycosyltransferase [Bdellovibrionales bacterium]|nr:glycosyltransferase [Bdellovibrionales bacterium]
MFNIVILTSRKNYTWKSMEEIIPFIEFSWSQLKAPDVNVETIFIEETSLSDLLKKAISASHIVLTCFTPEIFRATKFIRFEMKLDVHLIVHLHNQSTISCWPIRFWGDSYLFLESDIFISSCSRDKECLFLTYPKATSYVVPFSYKEYRKKYLIPLLPTADEIPLFYIGRLSSQKNLHTLILSLDLLKRHFPLIKWKMSFYGEEDFLGSPNMGWRDRNYKELLINLVNSLKLSDDIQFYGQVDRAILNKNLSSNKGIFISPSLHSDENFGMAAFKALTTGHLAVLSDWGGHFDFKKSFNDTVNLTPVYQTPNGPFISPSDLCLCIIDSLKSYSTNYSKKIPAQYSIEDISSKYRQILNDSKTFLKVKSQTLQPSKLSNDILEKAKFSLNTKSFKIFSDYSDPLSHSFFQAYGMKHKLPIFDCSNKVSLPPWITRSHLEVTINDPHRGSFVFNSNTENSTFINDGFAYLSDFR